MSVQLDEVKIQTLIELCKTNISRTSMTYYFSSRVNRDTKQSPNGKKRVTISEPYFSHMDTFTVTPDMLESVKEPIKTTVGIYLFNAFCLNGCFGNRVDYVNDTLTTGRFEDLLKNIIQKSIENIITPAEVAKFYNRCTFLTSFCELFAPGISTSFLSLPKEVQTYKKKLMSDNKDIIESGDVALFNEKVEGPLLRETERVLSKDPCWNLIEFNKKKFFRNNYKNSCITNGAIYDTIRNRYVISENAFMDGVPLENYSIYANMGISGSYSRHVETQYGGAQTKYMLSSLQYVKLDRRDSDCGTTKTVGVKIDKNNVTYYHYRYFIENGKVLHFTPEVSKKYIGSLVHFRTPLYCKSKNICNKCFNSLYYDMGIENAGLTSIRPTGTIMYIAMAAMHDNTVKTIHINPLEYAEVVK